MDKKLKEEFFAVIKYDRFKNLDELGYPLMQLLDHIDQQDQKIEKMQKDIQNLQISNRTQTKLK